MTTILAVSGSLRVNGFNSMLLRAAVAAAPEGATIEVGSIREIPLYDGDVEAASGLPAAVVALKEKVVAADGLLIVSPEYNNGIPGVLKNAIDWLSRPGADIPRVFGERAVGVIGATPGRGGTAMAQAAWLPVLRTLGMHLYTGGRLQVPSAGKVFDADGALIDDTTRTQLEKYMTGFTRFITRNTTPT
ncbi:MAG: NAD(P)H-dependent oxidoreductase [Labilithrix sp.]|nr:NAD(P)H-dependent oxidoreductase [Labilithrix sp.]MCW5818164.1 NAD(P)H-dependent oxidoreductase [Labilithrix sp.]